MEKYKLTVSKIDVVGTNAPAFNRSASSFNVVLSGAHDLKTEFKPTAKRSYAESLRIYSNNLDKPVKIYPRAEEG